VRAFLSSGGTEKQIIDAAAASRVKVWRRIAWKRARTTTTTTSTSAPTQPKNVVGKGGLG